MTEPWLSLWYVAMMFGPFVVGYLIMYLAYPAVMDLIHSRYDPFFPRFPVLAWAWIITILAFVLFVLGMKEIGP